MAWCRSHPWRRTPGDLVADRSVAAVRCRHRHARKRPGGLPRIAVDPAPLAHRPATGVPAAVWRVLVCHLPCAGLARSVSLRHPEGGIRSPRTLCPRGDRFPRGAARTALYPAGAARLSRLFAPAVPRHPGRADGCAGAPARRVSLVGGAADQLAGAATLQHAPRPGTCSPTEPLPRAAPHPRRGPRLGPAHEEWIWQSTSVRGGLPAQRRDSTAAKRSWLASSQRQ